MEEVFAQVKLENPEEIKDTFYKTGYFARKCYDTKENFEAVGKHVIKAKHGSAMRRVNFVFSIEGVSRVFSHQHVRHNTGVAHNQRSQRNNDESDFNYVVPITIKNNPEALDCLIKTMAFVNKQYKYLLSLGIPLEDARYILPNACETKIVSVFSLQALIHYCNERMCLRAEKEIRTVANLMKQEVARVDPNIAELLVPKCSDLLYCPEGKKDCIRPAKDEFYKAYMIWKEDAI